MNKLLAIAVIFFSVFPALQAAENAGKTIMAKGSVKAEIDNKMRNLKRRSPIFTKDIVKTGSRSTTQLRMIDGGLLSLNPESQLAINKYAFNKLTNEGSVSISLLKGGFRTMTGALNKGSNNYKMHTPVASIGVRGTYYEVELVNGDLYLATWDGIIDIEVLAGTDKHQFSLGPALEYKFAIIRTDGSFEFSLSIPSVFSEDFNRDSDENEEEEEQAKEQTELSASFSRNANTKLPLPITTTKVAENNKNELVDDTTYYEDDKKKVLVDNKSYYEKDKKNVLVKDQSYYEKNKKISLVDDQPYYEKDKEIFLVDDKYYYEKNKEILLVDDLSYYATALEEKDSKTFFGNELQISTWALDTGLNYTGALTFSQLEEHAVFSSDGDISNFAVSMNISFDTARVSNGKMSFDDNTGEWFAAMDGVIVQGELDLNINFASHNNNLADGEVSGILINTDDGVLGRFSLSEKLQPAVNAGGTFILNSKK